MVANDGVRTRLGGRGVAVVVAGLMVAAGLLSGCGPGPGELGASCESDGDCDTGACLRTFTGGYCSQRCEDTACPTGSRCAALDEGSYCLQDCSFGFFDCRSGYYCAEVGAGSVCVPDCATDEDCGPGARCEDKHCAPSGPGGMGAACRYNAGCQSERCEIAFNGGYCTATCAQDGPGSFGQGCPSGAVCAEVSEVGGLCHATCTEDPGCREDYYCDVSGTLGVCRPRCRGAATCGLGFSCQPDGQCVEGSAAPRQLGARCGADAECDSSYCLDQPSTDFPGGVCSADCSSNPGVCGEQGLCLVPADPQSASVCLQTCATNFDCRADYFCSSVSGSTQQVCLPRCTATPLCTSPLVCDTFSGQCVEPGAQGAQSVERVAIGTFRITGAKSQQDFALEVPDDAVSFTLVLKGRVGGTSVVARLFSPSGEKLFDLDNYLESKVRILPVNDGDFGMLFPNSPRVPLVPGRYRFTVYNEEGDSSGELFALMKRSPSKTLSSGRLDLNLWFAGVDGVSAANAATDASMQAALQELRRIYAQVGISLGTVRYFDVPASQAAGFAVIDTIDGKDSELRRLFEISAGAPNNAMNFFLVREIKGGGSGFTILGIAGGIPGIPFEQGTNASGVAVTTLDLKADPLEVARTMAHEGGHWLGLWHTSERNGQMHDPLSDTPECSTARDADKDEIVTTPECAGSGAEYLMFWQAGPTAATVSGNQGFVLLRNPVVGSP